MNILHYTRTYPGLRCGWQNYFCATLPSHSLRPRVGHVSQNKTRAVKKDVEEALQPWAFGFQCNERYLDWDKSAQRRLLLCVASEKLDKPMEWVEAKVSELAVLLPDIVVKLDRIKADVLLQLLEDTQGLAAKLVKLRSVLGTLDVSELVARHPAFFLQHEPETMQARMDALRAALPGANVEWLVDKEPNILFEDVNALLEEVCRLLGSADRDSAKNVLLQNPMMVLDMVSAGLESAIDGDLTQDERANDVHDTSLMEGME